MSEWYHKFLTPNEDGAGRIEYTDDEFNIPIVHIMAKSDSNNEIAIDCSPSCTYHIGFDELDVVTDTLYDLIEAGIVEKVIK